MDTKRPNYETVIVRMAPKFTKCWSKREKQNYVHWAVQILWYLWPEVTSFYPSWETRGIDKFKWTTVPWVQFSTWQDLHCVSRPVLSLFPNPNLFLTTSLPIKEWPEVYLCLPAGWWGRCHPLLKYKNTLVSSQGVLLSVHISFSLQVPNISNQIIQMGKTTFTSLYIICLIKYHHSTASLLEGLNISSRIAHGISQQRRYM